MLLKKQILTEKSMDLIDAGETFSFFKKFNEYDEKKMQYN